MSDRVRKILFRQRYDAERGEKERLPRRELFSRLVLVGLGVFVVLKLGVGDEETVGPPPLTEIERETALDIARRTNIPLEEAEGLVLAHRRSAAERRQAAEGRQEREAAAEAMQRAFPD